MPKFSNGKVKSSKRLINPFLFLHSSSQILPSHFPSNFLLSGVSAMLLSRLRRFFSSKPSSSSAYRRLYTPPLPIAHTHTLYPRPPSPLPIYHDDRNRSESPPPQPISIGNGGSGNEEKTSAIYRIENEKEVSTDCSFEPVGADIRENEEKSSAMYRIENELRAMNEEAATHCSFGPVGADIFRWEGVVIGPACSCYEGGIFHLSIQFPSDYPLSPPHIKFLTKVSFVHLPHFIFLLLLFFSSYY